MNKLVIPTILVSITLVAGIFAFIPVEKASTVHTTIQGTQLTSFDVAFVDDTKTANATATCGITNGGLVYWTVSNSTLSAAGGPTTSTFTLTSDGVFDGNDLEIVLDQNFTSTSGTTAIAGATAIDFSIGFDSTGTQNVGDILVSVQCQSGDTADAAATAN